MAKMAMWIKLALAALFLVGLGFWLRPFFAGDRLLQPILAQWGDLTLHWYGFLIALGIVFGLGLTLYYTNRFFHVSIDAILTAAIWMIVGGMLGARLVFVLLKWPLFTEDWTQIFAYTAGGLSIHGAVLGGLAALAIYSRLAKISVLKLANLFMPAVVLGQAIGRFGNFFNQEAYGGPTNLPWKMFVTLEMRPAEFTDVAFFHPTFLYEALGLLIILGILFWLIQRQPFVLFGWYLILYSGLRFFIEFLRIDSDMWGVLTVAQWASVAIAGVGAWLLINQRKPV
ncbi:MAG: prolipoprotein diacylglyceryl transferase [Patescibacteria group bacterium]|nr:prolipoprotein diacylglyceryl transferase [Patescibacteria group bacterium]